MRYPAIIPPRMARLCHMLTSSMLKILISSSPVGTGHTPPFFSASVHVKTNPIIRHNRVSMMDVLIIGKIKL